jgi:hypothetical protein
MRAHHRLGGEGWREGRVRDDPNDDICFRKVYDVVCPMWIQDVGQVVKSGEFAEMRRNHQSGTIHRLMDVTSVFSITGLR